MTSCSEWAGLGLERLQHLGPRSAGSLSFSSSCVTLWMSKSASGPGELEASGPRRAFSAISLRETRAARRPASSSRRCRRPVRFSAVCSMDLRGDRVIQLVARRGARTRGSAIFSSAACDPRRPAAHPMTSGYRPSAALLELLRGQVGPQRAGRRPGRTARRSVVMSAGSPAAPRHRSGPFFRGTRGLRRGLPGLAPAGLKTSDTSCRG